MIVPGNISTKAAGGTSPFRGKDAANPYAAMAEAYKKLVDEP